MILLIYNQDTSKFYDLQKKHGLPCDFTCNSKGRLKYLMDNYPNDDIEGYIVRDADQNPDFTKMMEMICRRKLEVYEALKVKNPNTPRIHDEFADKILKEFSHIY